MNQKKVHVRVVSSYQQTVEFDVDMDEFDQWRPAPRAELTLEADLEDYVREMITDGDHPFRLPPVTESDFVDVDLVEIDETAEL